MIIQIDHETYVVIDRITALHAPENIVVTEGGVIVIKKEHFEVIRKAFEQFHKPIYNKELIKGGD